MRIATFNLLHGMPVLGAPRATDGQRQTGPPAFDPALLVASIQQLDADVIGMQEVDVFQVRSGGSDQVELVREAMSASTSLYVPTVLGTPGEPGWAAASESMEVVRTTEPQLAAQCPPAPTTIAVSTYGVALVSRWPVLAWEVVRFPASRGAMPLLIPGDPRPQVVKVADEPRAAIAAVIDGPIGVMTVVTAHLSFVPGVNIAQVRSLREQVAHLPRPIVLAGDLNLPGRLPARATGWRSLARGATYPSLRPAVQFDHALADGLPADVTSVATVHRLPVSDHLGLTVDLERR